MVLMHLQFQCTVNCVAFSLREVRREDRRVFDGDFVTWSVWGQVLE